MSPDGKTAHMTVQQKIGQRFTIGFTGTKISGELRRLVREYKIGNIILFKNMLTNADQAKALCEDIQELVVSETGYPAFISLDQEGGTVVRLPPDMINVPGAMALAASGNMDNIAEAAFITAAELQRTGINLNLAPVLDINCNRDNPVIGIRSFSVQTQEAADCAVAAVRAYNKAGIMCCGKHFPGHGDTSVDSHLDLPLINISLEELEKRELVPFKAAISENIPAIMTAHILFPKIEPEKLPATMSAKILKELLREKLGFEGLIFSDGMEMNAIKNHFGIPRGCVLALSAGVDNVLVCHESPDMEESFKAVKKAYDEGFFDIDEFDASVERILKYKKPRITRMEKGLTRNLKIQKYFIRANPDNPWKSVFNGIQVLNRKKLTKRVTQLTRSTLASNFAGKPPPLGNNPFFAGSLDYRSNIASADPEGSLSFSRWFSEQFGGNFLETPVYPTPEDITGILSAIPEATSIVFGCYNGHLNSGQMELAIALFENAKQKNIPFFCLALRNPWDLHLLPEGAYGLVLWEYTEKSFEAAAAVLRGEFIPTGRINYA